MYGSTKLTPREKRVVRLLARGLRNIDIANAMGTTRYVVMNQLARIYDKVGLDSRLQLALWWTKYNCDRCPRLGGHK